jgi:hypothetical protein
MLLTINDTEHNATQNDATQSDAYMQLSIISLILK